MNDTAHHAILFEGEGESGKIWVREYLEKQFSLTVKGNPDVHFIERERFTVKDAHLLKTEAYQAPFGAVNIFVIVCEMILREAQNALLKLFEEPAVNTHFVILIPNRHGLLPTVNSRLSFEGRVLGTLKEEDLAEKFLKCSIGERLSMLDTIVKDKERIKAREFLDALEVVLRKNGFKNNTSALKELTFIRTYLSDTASSLKMLMEHLAITM
jgi:DNA polymerase-3 subunit delta'